MNRKQRVRLSVQQKLEDAKLMVNEGDTNQQFREISGAGSTTVSRKKRQYLAEINGETPEGKKL